MSDYIKREDAELVLKSWQIGTFIDLGPIPSADVVEVDKAQKEIDYWHDKAQSYEQTILKLSLNKADVVEVVRCKDCKWWDNEGDAERCAQKYGGMWAKPDGYCSYGERADT